MKNLTMFLLIKVLEMNLKNNLSILTQKYFDILMNLSVLIHKIPETIMEIICTNPEQLIISNYNNNHDPFEKVLDELEQTVLGSQVSQPRFDPTG